MKQQCAYRFVFVVLFVFHLSICSASETPGEELKVVVERNVPVPMRDVTILRADVYRPDRGGPYPVLLQRTWYGKGRRSFGGYVKAGYIVVEQDIRGKYESEGEDPQTSFEYYWKNSQRDGYDTVEWAAKLSGSNGKVGTFGGSAMGIEQYYLASLNPPSLVVMSAQNVSNSSFDIHRTGTIRPELYMRSRWRNLLPNWRKHQNRPGVHTQWEAGRLWEKDSEKWINFLPWLDIPSEVFWFNRADVMSVFGGRFFDSGKRIVEVCRDISVPNLDITGWYDWCNGEIRLFRTMVSGAKTELARKGSRIIIGPWTHTTSGQRRVGDFDFGPNARLDLDAIKIRWLDYWLKGKDNAINKEPRVRIFVMGDNQWRDEQQWPLQRTKDKVLFVSSNGHANTPIGDGKLTYEDPKQTGKDQYLYDPKDPVPTVFDPTKVLMPFDQRPLAGREDILVYQTEPLRERIEVTGNPVVELYASSSAPDTDWFVRLIDVAPDGSARNVSMGVVRARYRDGFHNPRLIKSGEVVKYTIRMMPTSNAFLPEHRIRLDITSSDFPNYDRNHNTAVNQNADATLIVANQTIYHGGEHATRIILPRVPNLPEEVKPAQEEKVEEGSVKDIYALHQAAADGDIDQVRILTAKGIDVNAQDEAKWTPLHYAANSGIAEIARLLLEAGADVDVKAGETERTPLYIAAKAGKKELVKLLLEAGADINDMGTTPWPPLCAAIERNHIDVVEYLIAHGADVNAANPLRAAAYEGHVEMIKLLLANGADINAGGRRTALRTAIRENHPNVAKLLIANGADINVGPYTILHTAVNEDRMDMVKLLLQNGANVNAQDEDGRTPLDLAIRSDQKDIVELLIGNGVDVNTKDDRGLTALHNAAVEGHQEITELLLSKGVKVDERDDNYEFTALHYAARFGTTKVAEVLIAHGADIKAKDKWAYEPIHWAAYHDRPEIVELLIAKGADVNVKTSLGKTPLELAMPRRNTAAIEVLRKHGAKE